MTKNFFCAMYPNLNKLSDYALEQAWGMMARRVRLNPSEGCFKCGFSYGDHVEAMAMIVLEAYYRWNNGGEAEFNAMIKRTFNR